MSFLKVAVSGPAHGRPVIQISASTQWSNRRLAQSGRGLWTWVLQAMLQRPFKGFVFIHHNP